MMTEKLENSVHWLVSITRQALAPKKRRKRPKSSPSQVGLQVKGIQHLDCGADWITVAVVMLAVAAEH